MNFFISKFLVCAILIHVRAKSMCPSLNSFTLFMTVFLMFLPLLVLSHLNEKKLYIFCVEITAIFILLQICLFKSFVYECFVCIFVRVTHGLEPLELQLQMVVSHHACSAGCLQEQHVPQTTKLPLQLPPTAILFFTATTIAQ